MYGKEQQTHFDGTLWFRDSKSLALIIPLIVLDGIEGYPKKGLILLYEIRLLRSIALHSEQHKTTLTSLIS